MIKVSKLKKNPNNPRLLHEDKFEKLKNSLREFPQMMSLRPIIVDAENIVLGGNMRLEAIKVLGMKEIPDEWVKRADDLTEAQKQEFIVKDNVGFGEWDWDALGNSWSDLPLEDWGLDVPNFEIVEDAPEEDESAVAETISKAKELQAKWGTESGQLWKLGEHRLLCGDSTKREDVERLDNSDCNLMITDPPYGVEYDADWRNDALRADGTTIGGRAIGKVENDDRADWTETWRMFQGNVIYCWHAGRHASEVQASLELAGFEMRSQIIWAKNNFAISRGHYHWKHEPCWYAVRKDNHASWIGDHSQTTVWEIDKPQKSETGHSTQKPIECMARPIKNHEGNVYEPFSGSGTTLIACEQLNRKCRAIEISAEYIAVCLERWHNLTGKMPELLESDDSAKTDELNTTGKAKNAQK